MFQGELIGIFIGERKQEPLQSMEQVEAVQGRGLLGDRYCKQQGTFSKPLPDREVTLIELEALEALQGETDITLQPAEARRNLLTRGVPLNHLVGKEFLVGKVRLRGLRLCEPCTHLEGLTVAGVLKGLCHRGGLRAQILQGGMLNRGDVVKPCET